MAPGRKPKGKHPDKRLTPVFVRKTSKPGRYCDGNGLYLKVDTSGARRWEQRLVIQGRQRTLGLGGVPLVSLAEAREEALANRKAARTGGDPMDLRWQASIPTFEAAVTAVVELHRPSWRNAKHAAQWEATLRTYVYPRLGKRPVSNIYTADVLSVLMPIWHEKPETARRVRQRISTVMKWAVAQGFRQDNPAVTPSALYFPSKKAKAWAIIRPCRMAKSPAPSRPFARPVAERLSNWPSSS